MTKTYDSIKQKIVMIFAIKLKMIYTCIRNISLI